MFTYLLKAAGLAPKPKKKKKTPLSQEAQAALERTLQAEARENSAAFLQDVFFRMFLNDDDFLIIPTLLPPRSPDQKEYDEICGTRPINPESVDDFLVYLKQPLMHSSCLFTLLEEPRIRSIERLEAIDNQLVFTLRVRKPT